MNYAVLALIITNIIWGAAAPIFKYSLQNIPPFTLAFLRFFVASIIFFPFVLGKWKKIELRDFLEICLAAFLGITFHISTFFLGLQQGLSINAPIIAASGPLFLYLFALFFLKERPHPKILIGLIISLFGVMFLILSPFATGDSLVGASQTRSNFLYLLSTFGMVASALISKRILTRINPYQFTFIAYIFATISFYPLFLSELSTWSFSMLDSRGILGIIFGAVLSSCIAYFLFYWGISKIRAQEIGIFQYIDPLVALVVAIPLLGEYPTPTYFLAAILIFLGIFIAEGRLHWHPFHKLRL